MKILALDTSSARACIAILEDENVLIELNNTDEKTHSQKLMPMIDEAFKKTNLSLDDISLIACGIGPGSFTGVRIGITTAKAFMDSKNIAGVGISSLEALAYNLNKPGYICSLIDAGHENVYAGIFNIIEENGILKTKENNLSFLSFKNERGELTSDNLFKFLKSTVSNNEPIYFVGNGAITYKNLLLEKNKNIFFANEDECNISSITIAKIGYTNYKCGNYGSSDILVPIYLRKSQAELTLEQKN